MPLILQKRIYRTDLQNNPSVNYVFGDNLQREGVGGQAREMRGEPNAIGIATKYAPLTGDAVYFKDKDYEKLVKIIDDDMEPVVDLLERRCLVVWPEDGIGTGYARLDRYAPKLLEYINFRTTGLREAFSG